MIIRKVTNVSESEIGLKLKNGDTVFLKPEQTVENVEVAELQKIKGKLQLEYDLSEVNPINEGTQKIYG